LESDNSMRPLLLGHRGARASREFSENTLPCFELCLKHGCDGFEFDVRRASDGVAVICHDSLARGLPIERTPARKLPLPALADVLRQFSSRAFLDIELKVGGLEPVVCAALREYPPGHGYLVSSFLPEVLNATHALDSSIPLGFLCDTRTRLPVWQELPVQWVIPQLGLVDRKLVARLRSAGKKVMVWTANQAPDILRVAGWGVDAIISDETELLVRSFP